MSNDPTGLVAAKSALREQIRQRRAARSAADLEATTRRIGELVAHRIASLKPGTATAYLEFGAEPSMAQAIGVLREAGWRVLVPIVQPRRQLHWAEFTGADATELSAYGIPEPTTPVLARNAMELAALGTSLMLVPATAIDINGSRLGQGGGYYDTLLAQLPRYPVGPLRIGIVFADEIVPELPHNPLDQPVDEVIGG